MKLLFLVTTLLLCASARAEKAPKAYLCAQLSEEAKRYNDSITSLFGTAVSFFKPQNVSPEAPIYETDLSGMESADFVLILPPYGRDCAFEVGWFAGKAKPIIFYAEKGGDWQRDVMIKGGVTRVLTTNSALYENLMKDPELGGKVTLIPSKQALKEAVLTAYHNSKKL